ncbi:MAG: hypothetical protein LBQ34_07575 [Alphaproteobacteria bacterium]|nr:hypothetical protein [Alphaproteobacteria bacterium]
MNGFVRNYVSNTLVQQSPKIYHPFLILDAVQFSGFPMVYNHDILEVGGVQYSLEEEFMIIYNTENNSATIDFKYIKGIK